MPDSPRAVRDRPPHGRGGLELLEGYRASQDDDATAQAVCGHITALLIAQGEDAMQLFRKEARALGSSLDALGPEASRLLSVREDQGLAGSDANFLRALESGIAEVDTVTVHLHRAFAQSTKLGSETTEMAGRLSRRLRAVRKVQRDVAQMAWNTGLKCRNMGQDGQGLAVMSTEIRNFANSLAEVWTHVSDTFEALLAAASLINGAEVPAAVEGALALSLERIRTSGEQLETGLASLGQHGPKVVALIRDAEEGLDCEDAIGGPFDLALAELGGFARPVGTALAPAVSEAIAGLADEIAQLYTTAREREVHRRFAIA